jgi:hypothetical protein
MVAPGLTGEVGERPAQSGHRHGQQRGDENDVPGPPDRLQGRHRDSTGPTEWLPSTFISGPKHLPITYRKAPAPS